MDLLAARAAARAAPQSPPVSQLDDEWDGEWNDIAEVIGMEDFHAIGDIVDDWGMGYVEQEPAAPQPEEAPQPKEAPQPILPPEDVAPPAAINVDEESAAAAAALLPWLAIGLALAKKN